MDCEKFETALMDELYGELDELTSAAAKRHVSGCARCSALIGGLRATRRVAALPRVDPPEGLEQRILLAAARVTPKVVPLRGRIARAVSLAGSWAMRPQTAMAAVFLVMIGTSVLLLRGKSSRAPASAQITVTEEGTPAPAAATASASGPARDTAGADLALAEPPPAAPPAPVALAYASRPEKAERAAAPSVANAPAPEDLERRAAPKGAMASGGAAGAGMAADRAAVDDGLAAEPAQPSDPADELWAARAARDAAARQGHPCSSGPRFDSVASRAPGTQAGWDALYEGALCYLSAGDYGSARTRLGTLLGVPSYSARARYTLDRMNKQIMGIGGGESAARAAAPAATANASAAPFAAAPAAAAPPPAAHPAAAPAGPAKPAAPASKRPGDEAF